MIDTDNGLTTVTIFEEGIKQLYLSADAIFERSTVQDDMELLLSSFLPVSGSGNLIQSNGKPSLNNIVVKRN